MGSAQALLSVPASHKVGQQHTKHYLSVFKQSAYVWFHLRVWKHVFHLLTMARKYRCGNKVPIVKAWLNSRTSQPLELCNLQKNSLKEFFCLWYPDWLFSVLSHAYKRSVILLWALSWNKPGFIYLSHPHVILQIAINSHCVTLQNSLSSLSAFLSVPHQNSVHVCHWKEKVSKKEEESTIALADFDSFQLALIPFSLSWDWVIWKEIQKQPKWQTDSSKPTTRAFVSFSSHSHSRRNKELERENIIFCDMFMRWGDGREKKSPNKRRQRKTVSGGDDSQNSGVKTFHLPFDFLRRTCPMFRGRKATREEHLRSDWRIGARTLFRHKLGGEGCSSFIYIVLHLGNEVPPLLRFTRVCWG